MKMLIITFFLSLFHLPDPPVGMWLYKPDTTRIEISANGDTLSGILISSANPDRKSGTGLFKEFIYKDGSWRGRLYLPEKDRWVDATIKQVDNLLIVAFTYGLVDKKFHLYRKS